MGPKKVVIDGVEYVPASEVEKRAQQMSLEWRIMEEMTFRCDDPDNCPTCQDPNAQHCVGCGCDTSYIPGNPHDMCYTCFWGKDD